MAFIQDLPRSWRGNTELLVVNDVFSKFVWAEPMNKLYNQKVSEFLEKAFFQFMGLLNFCTLPMLQFFEAMLSKNSLRSGMHIMFSVLSIVVVQTILNEPIELLESFWGPILYFKKLKETGSILSIGFVVHCESLAINQMPFRVISLHPSHMHFI